MTKEDIVNYVMNTPYNSNPAVLRSMLDQYNNINKNVIIYDVIDEENPIFPFSYKDLEDAYLQGATVILHMYRVAQPDNNADTDTYSALLRLHKVIAYEDEGTYENYEAFFEGCALMSSSLNEPMIYAN